MQYIIILIGLVKNGLSVVSVVSISREQAKKFQNIVSVVQKKLIMKKQKKDLKNIRKMYKKY